MRAATFTERCVAVGREIVNDLIVDTQRQPDLGGEDMHRPRETFRHDADDGEGPAVDDHFRADQRRITVLFQPIIVTDNGHRRAAARRFLFSRKGTPLHRENTQHREIIRADDVGEGASRVAFLADPDHAQIVTEDVGEDRVLFADVAVGGIRKFAERFRILFVLGKELHDLRRLSVGGRTKQHGVDETENGGVHPNAEGEHNDSGDGKPRRFPKLPERKAKIVNHILIAVCRR